MSWCMPTCMIAAACGLLTSLGMPSQCHAQSTDLDQFRREALRKWDEYEKAVPVCQISATFEREQIHKDGKKEWERNKVEIKQRQGFVANFNDYQTGAMDKPLVRCFCLNPKYSFEVKRKDSDRGWFLVRSTTTERDEKGAPGAIIGIPTPEDLRGWKLQALSVFGHFAPRLLPQLMAEPSMSIEVKRAGADYVISFANDKSKPRTIKDPFTRGTITIDPDRFLIRSCETEIDVPNQARIKRVATHTYVEVSGIPLREQYADSYEGYDYYNKCPVKGTRKVSCVYSTNVPAEGEFTLESFGLADAAVSVEKELRPPPGPFPYHLAFVGLGVLLLAAAAVVVRRGRQANRSTASPSLRKGIP